MQVILVVCWVIIWVTWRYDGASWYFRKAMYQLSLYWWRGPASIVQVEKFFVIMFQNRTLPIFVIQHLYIKFKYTYYEHEHQCSLIPCVTGAQPRNQKQALMTSRKKKVKPGKSSRKDPKPVTPLFPLQPTKSPTDKIPDQVYTFPWIYAWSWHAGCSQRQPPHLLKWIALDLSWLLSSFFKQRILARSRRTNGVKDLRLARWNADGVRSRKLELDHFLSELGVELCI
jgi:hypothetical protein